MTTAVRGLGPGAHPALVISECQNAMVNPDLAGNDGLSGQAAERGIVARIATLADAFRRAGRPVVHSTIVPRVDQRGSTVTCLLQGAMAKKGLVVAGRPEAEIHPGLTPHPGDFVIERKHGLTPFHGTELEPLLRAEQVGTVVLVGVSTNVGLPAACVEAVNRGFTVVVPEDCTAGAWPAAHEFQVTHTLPLLATVTTGAAVAAAVAAAP